MSSFKWQNSHNISIAKENRAKGLGLERILQREAVWCSRSLHLAAFMFHIEIRVPSDWVGLAGLNASFILSDVRDLQESYSLLELFRAAPLARLPTVAPKSSQTYRRTLFPNTAWCCWDCLGIRRGGTASCTAGCATLCWGNHKSSNTIALLTPSCHFWPKWPEDGIWPFHCIVMGATEKPDIDGFSEEWFYITESTSQNRKQQLLLQVVDVLLRWVINLTSALKIGTANVWSNVIWFK